MSNLQKTSQIKCDNCDAIHPKCACGYPAYRQRNEQAVTTDDLPEKTSIFFVLKSSMIWGPFDGIDNAISWARTHWQTRNPKLHVKDYLPFGYHIVNFQSPEDGIKTQQWHRAYDDTERWAERNS